MKPSKLPYSVSLQSLMSEVKIQEEKEKKNVASKIANAIPINEILIKESPIKEIP